MAASKRKSLFGLMVPKSEGSIVMRQHGIKPQACDESRKLRDASFTASTRLREGTGRRQGSIL